MTGPSDTYCNNFLHETDEEAALDGPGAEACQKHLGQNRLTVKSSKARRWRCKLGMGQTRLTADSSVTRELEVWHGHTGSTNTPS